MIVEQADAEEAEAKVEQDKAKEEGERAVLTLAWSYYLAF